MQAISDLLSLACESIRERRTETSRSLAPVVERTLACAWESRRITGSPPLVSHCSALRPRDYTALVCMCIYNASARIFLNLRFSVSFLSFFFFLFLGGEERRCYVIKAAWQARLLRPFPSFLFFGCARCV